jgi:hypothetical protein
VSVAGVPYALFDKVADLALLETFVDDMLATMTLAPHVEPDRRVIIRHKGETLITRTVLARSADQAVYLHRWHKSDSQDPHDHPWDFVSLILAVGYWEVTETGRHWRAPGSVAFHTAEYRHRVELEADDEVTGGEAPISLIICGQHRREWGFYPVEGFVPAAEYKG